ncbi:MAG: hypothetical protein ACI8RD_008882 [Bacillariaceae sp.]
MGTYLFYLIDNKERRRRTKIIEDKLPGFVVTNVFDLNLDLDLDFATIDSFI